MSYAKKLHWDLGTSMFLLPTEFANNPNTKNIISSLLREEMILSLGWEYAEDENVSSAWLQSLENEILAELDQLPNPFHNGNHSRRVRDRTVKYARHALFPEAQVSLLHISALFHDYGHAGTRFRQLAQDSHHQKLSNEEFSALEADRHLTGKLTLKQRLQVQGLILSTSFGQDDLQKLPQSPFCDLYRPYQPTTDLEQLFQFADIAAIDEDPEAYLSSALAVAKEKAVAGEPFFSFEGFLQSEIQFLYYVQNRFQEVKKLLAKGDVVRIRQKLDTAAAELDQLVQGKGQWQEMTKRLYQAAQGEGFRL